MSIYGPPLREFFNRVPLPVSPPDDRIRYHLWSPYVEYFAKDGIAKYFIDNGGSDWYLIIEDRSNTGWLYAIPRQYVPRTFDPNNDKKTGVVAFDGTAWVGYNDYIAG